jgi:rubrerythrin
MAENSKLEPAKPTEPAKPAEPVRPADEAKPDKPDKPAEPGKKKKWRCTVCGYIYEGETLPPDYICPVCHNGAEVFVPVE